MSAWTLLSKLGPGLLLLIALTMPQSILAAPLDEDEDTTELEYYPVADSTGCYYNFQHYDQGDRIITNEPCLNCTCHHRMLMCYLRVCPFTKAIGQDCKVEKRADQCCPVITCPEVPVQLLPSTTPSPTDVGHLDTYGCMIQDLFYSDGARVPSHPNEPCELCYCIRNKTACVMQECTLKIEGCAPVYQKGVCCPVRYNCDHPQYDLLETTTKLLLTTTTTTTQAPTTIAGPVDCIYNNDVYADGALIVKDAEKPCEHCYCMRGDIVCAVQECGPTPLDKVNCTALPIKEGECCTRTYDCDNLIEDRLTTLGDGYTTVPSIVDRDQFDKEGGKYPERPESSVKDKDGTTVQPDESETLTPEMVDHEEPVGMSPSADGTSDDESGAAGTEKPEETPEIGTEKVDIVTPIRPEEVQDNEIPTEGTGRPVGVTPASRDEASTKEPEDHAHTSESDEGKPTEAPKAHVSEGAEGISTATPGGPIEHTGPPGKLDQTESPHVTESDEGKPTEEPEVHVTESDESRKPTEAPEDHVSESDEGKPTEGPKTHVTEGAEGITTATPGGPIEHTGPPGKLDQTEGSHVTESDGAKPTEVPKVHVSESDEGKPTEGPKTGVESISTETPEGVPEHTGPPHVTKSEEGKPTEKPEDHSTESAEGEATETPEGAIKHTGRPVTGQTESPVQIGDSGVTMDQKTERPTQRPESYLTESPEGKPTEEPESQSTERAEGEATETPEGAIKHTGRPVTGQTQSPVQIGDSSVTVDQKSTEGPTERPESALTESPEGTTTGDQESESAKGKPSKESEPHVTETAEGRPTEEPESHITESAEGKPTEAPEGAIKHTGRPVTGQTESPVQIGDSSVTVDQKSTERPTERPESALTESPEGTTTGDQESESAKGKPSKESEPHVTETAEGKPTEEPESHSTESAEGKPTEAPEGAIKHTGRPVTGQTESPVQIGDSSVTVDQKSTERPTERPESALTESPEGTTTGDQESESAKGKPSKESEPHVTETAEGRPTEEPESHITESAEGKPTEAPEGAIKHTGRPVTGQTESPVQIGDSSVTVDQKSTERPTERPESALTESPEGTTTGDQESESAKGKPSKESEPHVTETAEGKPTEKPESHSTESAEGKPTEAPEGAIKHTGRPVTGQTESPVQIGDSSVTVDQKSTERPTERPGSALTESPEGTTTGDQESESAKGKPSKESEPHVTETAEDRPTEEPESHITESAEGKPTEAPEGAIKHTGRPVTGQTESPVQIGDSSVTVDQKSTERPTERPGSALTESPEGTTTGDQESESAKGKPSKESEPHVTETAEDRPTEEPESHITESAEGKPTEAPEGAIKHTGRPVTGQTESPVQIGDSSVTGDQKSTERPTETPGSALTESPEGTTTGDQESESAKGKPSKESEPHVTETAEGKPTEEPESHSTESAEGKPTEAPEGAIKHTGRPVTGQTQSPAEIGASSVTTDQKTERPTERPESYLTESAEGISTQRPEDHGTESAEGKPTEAPEGAIKHTGRPVTGQTQSPAEIGASSVTTDQKTERPTERPESYLTESAEGISTQRPEDHGTESAEGKPTEAPEGAIKHTGRPVTGQTQSPAEIGASSVTTDQKTERPTERPESYLTESAEGISTQRPEDHGTESAEGKPTEAPEGAIKHTGRPVTGQTQSPAEIGASSVTTDQKTERPTERPESYLTESAEGISTQRPEDHGTESAEGKPTEAPEGAIKHTGRPVTGQTQSPAEIGASSVTTDQKTERPTERPESYLTESAEGISTQRPEDHGTESAEGKPTEAPEGATGRPVTGQTESPHVTDSGEGKQTEAPEDHVTESDEGKPTEGPKTDVSEGAEGISTATPAGPIKPTGSPGKSDQTESPYVTEGAGSTEESVTQGTGAGGQPTEGSRPSVAEEEGAATEEPVTDSSESTEEPWVQPEDDIGGHGIPGEGSCLVHGQTYSNNSNVPPISHCQFSCKCVSSILQCKQVICTPPPANLQNCLPVYQGPDSCCPTYSCSVPGVTSMESDSHKMETTTKPATITPEVSKEETVPESAEGKPSKESEPHPTESVEGKPESQSTESAEGEATETPEGAMKHTGRPVTGQTQSPVQIGDSSVTMDQKTERPTQRPESYLTESPEGKPTEEPESHSTESAEGKPTETPEGAIKHTGRPVTGQTQSPVQIGDSSVTVDQKTERPTQRPTEGPGSDLTESPEGTTTRDQGSESAKGKPSKESEPHVTETAEGKPTEEPESHSTESAEGKPTETPEGAIKHTGRPVTGQTQSPAEIGASSVTTDQKTERPTERPESYLTESAEGISTQRPEDHGTESAEGKPTEAPEGAIKHTGRPVTGQTQSPAEIGASSVTTDQKTERPTERPESYLTESAEGISTQRPEDHGTESAEGKPTEAPEGAIKHTGRPVTGQTQSPAEIGASSVTTDQKTERPTERPESYLTESAEGISTQRPEDHGTESAEGKPTDAPEGAIKHTGRPVTGQTQSPAEIGASSVTMDQKTERPTERPESYLTESAEGISTQRPEDHGTESAEGKPTEAPEGAIKHTGRPVTGQTQSPAEIGASSVTMDQKTERPTERPESYLTETAEGKPTEEPESHSTESAEGKPTEAPEGAIKHTGRPVTGQTQSPAEIGASSVTMDQKTERPTERPESYLTESAEGISTQRPEDHGTESAEGKPTEAPEGAIKHTGRPVTGQTQSPAEIGASSVTMDQKTERPTERPESYLTESAEGISTQRPEDHGTESAEGKPTEAPEGAIKHTGRPVTGQTQSPAEVGASSVTTDQKTERPTERPESYLTESAEGISTQRPEDHGTESAEGKPTEAPEGAIKHTGRPVTGQTQSPAEIGASSVTTDQKTERPTERPESYLTERTEGKPTEEAESHSTESAEGKPTEGAEGAIKHTGRPVTGQTQSPAEIGASSITMDQATRSTQRPEGTTYPPVDIIAGTTLPGFTGYPEIVPQSGLGLGEPTKSTEIPPENATDSRFGEDEEAVTEHRKPLGKPAEASTSRPQEPSATQPAKAGETSTTPAGQMEEEEEEEEEFTSATRAPQANTTGLFTSGPPSDDTTKKSVAGELSTSGTARPTTSKAPVPTTGLPSSQEIPEYQDGQGPVDDGDYSEEEPSAVGPGTCRYGGKIYVSAQQIPRDDPCDFCFCFRSDIICLQQSCPPPIPRCHEEPIRGFCCPRYECPVSMATSLNVTTTTTTTTTTLPPHFLSHVYKGRAKRGGCQINNETFKIGDVIPSTSGPCMECKCGGDGQMKCDPKACSPEPMLHKMMTAVPIKRPSHY